jgi:hypothetical protein
MTPSNTVLREASQTIPAIDRMGRRLLLRRMTALDTLRLFKAAGPNLAQNGPWLSLAGLAFSVVEIEGVPVPAPATEAQIESLIDRLGDDGLAAIADVLKDDTSTPDAKAQVGNSLGTQS